MALITGSWRDTTLVCGNHPNSNELPEMTLQATAHTLSYVCPKCNPLNLDDNEAACKNKLPATEYEKMLNHVASIIADAEENDEIVNLRGYHWKRKTLSFKILRHDKDKMTISVVDRSYCDT